MSWEDSTPDERQASTSRMAYKEMGRANELQKKLDAAVRRAIASEDLLMSRAQQHADAEGEATRLRAQLLDANRNEERAVAENGELKTRVDELKGAAEILARNDARQAPIRRDFDRAMGAADALLKDSAQARSAVTQIASLKAKLHTLEAAVRAVRDICIPGEKVDTTAVTEALFALVPDGSEGGGA